MEFVEAVGDPWWQAQEIRHLAIDGDISADECTGEPGALSPKCKIVQIFWRPLRLGSARAQLVHAESPSASASNFIFSSSGISTSSLLVASASFRSLNLRKIALALWRMASDIF